MCDPLTATAVVAATVQAYSQVQQGRTAEKTANYNAREMENQATSIRNKGTEEENIKRRENAEFLSRQRAMLGASGIDIDSGSAGDLQQDTDILGEVDALRIRRNFMDQADTVERQSTLVREEGRSAKRAANLSALGTILGTAATLGASGAFASAPAAGTASAGAGVGGSLGAGGVNGGAVAPKWYSSLSAGV